MALVEDLVGIEKSVVSAAEKTAVAGVEAASQLLHAAAGLVKAALEAVAGDEE